MFSQGIESSQPSSQPTKLPSLASLHPHPQQSQQLQHQPPPIPHPLQNQATHYQQSVPQHFHQYALVNQPPPDAVKEEIRVTQATGAFSGSLRRGPWSLEEDKKLMEAINIFGPSNWVRISQNLGTRTPKQCRERYHQNLKPSLNRNPITPEEGQLIEELVAKHGKRWAEIARHLNGKSDNAIKNWWNGGANRRRRASTQAILEASGTTQQLATAPKLQGINTTNEYYPQFKTPSFNTSMFANGPAYPGGASNKNQQPLPPHLDHQNASLAPPHQVQPQQHSMPHTPSRSTSMTQEMFQQHQGVKRLLEEQHHYPMRRHSTQTILTSTAGSTSPFSTTFSRAGGDSSRNSSISIDYNLHSNSTSRRSSLVNPDFYPNSIKRQNSQTSATYLSPSFPSHRNPSITIPSGLTPLTAVFPPSQQHDETIFKPDFNFTKNEDAVKFPFYPQPNFNSGTSAVNPDYKTGETNSSPLIKVEKNDENKVIDENEAEPKTVMNISNLLS